MGEMAKRRYGIKFVRFVVAVVLSVGSVYACGCIEPSVQAKKDHAEVIFRGKASVLAARRNVLLHSPSINSENSCRTLLFAACCASRPSSVAR